MGRKAYKLPDSMMAVGSVPHSYLFDKCKMVIHHCGFGTSAATLIYGIPSIPVPHVLDQKGQTDMLIKPGVASDEIDGHNVTEESEKMKSKKGLFEDEGGI